MLSGAYLELMQGSLAEELGHTGGEWNINR